MKPRGDQPEGIRALVDGLRAGEKHQTLLGVTGSGKTFTLANVIAEVQRPALIISHNKTLAAQLYQEFRSFFPHNAVEFFVSYYDYYQPEAYLPRTDTYIEKDASINDELDRLRLAATSSLLERRDVVIVASVSAIYGLGSPEEHRQLYLCLEQGQRISQRDILLKLVKIQYERNDMALKRGHFRVRGDIVDIFPAYGETLVRIEQHGDLVERIRGVDALTGNVIEEKEQVSVYPAKHFVTSTERLETGILGIRAELKERLEELRSQQKLLEAERLEARSRYDIEMMQEVGYCQGIENYSRHLGGRAPGEPPYTLIDYFPEDYLLLIDESHVTLPQVRGMFFGDRSRKQTLVEHGFRLPSALDNRPLNFEEFEARAKQVIYVSATPSAYELEKSARVVEQIIRPTGLVDPIIHVKPVKGQVDDLIAEIRNRIKKGQRILVTTLTKRMAEDLADYLYGLDLKVRYLHSEVDTLERVEILRDLRMGKFDCLVGINLLREGLDLPEVSLVAILDADKEGFLRSQSALIQTAGRAARNVDGQVIMYADTVTGSMRRAIDETDRRRIRQLEYNQEHGITPRSIQKVIKAMIDLNKEAGERVVRVAREPRPGYDAGSEMHIADLKREMVAAAEELDFERAAELRDEIEELETRGSNGKGAGAAAGKSAGRKPAKRRRRTRAKRGKR